MKASHISCVASACGACRRSPGAAQGRPRLGPHRPAALPQRLSPRLAGRCRAWPVRVPTVVPASSTRFGSRSRLVHAPVAGRAGPPRRWAPRVPRQLPLQNGNIQGKGGPWSCSRSVRSAPDLVRRKRRTAALAALAAARPRRGGACRDAMPTARSATHTQAAQLTRGSDAPTC